MKGSEKPFQYKMIGVSVMLILFIFGMLLGCRYAVTSGEIAKIGAADMILGDKAISLTSTFSSFLFEHLFFLVAVFLFGLTFLGIAVIPAAVILKGAAVGISFSSLLVSEEISVYLQRWIIYLPAAFCVTVFILFSAYAFGASLRFCSLLRDKSAAAVSLKSYGLLFVSSLLILAASGCIHCVLSLLSVILF